MEQAGGSRHGSAADLGARARDGRPEALAHVSEAMLLAT